MKVAIARDELALLMGKIQGIVPAKPQLPILANILIETLEHHLLISATDLMVSMCVEVPAQILEKGSVSLNARRFFQLVRELSAPHIELSSPAEETAFLKAGTSHFKMHGISTKLFPTMPELSDEVKFSLSTSLLKEMLFRTAFAAAREETRQVLNGVFVKYSENILTFLATDGKRLAKLHTVSSSSLSDPKSWIIPLKAVEEIIRMLDTEEKQVDLTFTNDKCALEVGETTLITQLIPGDYPDVLRIIPEKPSFSVVLHREELSSLLRQVCLFTSEENCSALFLFTPGNLTLCAMSGNVGESRVNMIVNYEGPPLEIAFSPHSLLDILRHSKDETITLGLSSSFSPGIVTDSTSAFFLVMPMRFEV